MSTTAAPPESIEPAQFEAWRARLACAFPAVQDVLADCLLEARAALSPEGMDAYLDCAHALGRMGRGAEPVLAFLQEWPSVARVVGEELLNDVVALMQAMQKSPNSRAIAPLLQSLAAVARRLLGPGPMRDYLRVARELMQRTTVSIHGHHATFESPGLPVFLEHAPRALDVLNVAGLSRWADYGARHYQHHPERQRDYFALQSADSRAVLQRERHGTLLVTVERQLDLTLRCLWQDHAPLLSFSTGFDDSRAPTPFFDMHGIALPDVYDDLKAAGGICGLDRYRAALAHMAGHRRWSQPQIADNLSPLQRLTIECFEDARIDHLVLRQYPGCGRCCWPYTPSRSKAPATRQSAAACATGWRCCRAPCWTRHTATATKFSMLLPPSFTPAWHTAFPARQRSPRWPCATPPARAARATSRPACSSPTPW